LLCHLDCPGDFEGIVGSLKVDEMDFPQGVQGVAENSLNDRQQSFKCVVELGLHAILVFNFVIDQLLQHGQIIEELFALRTLMDLICSNINMVNFVTYLVHPMKGHP
jgi:hypothetical protein